MNAFKLNNPETAHKYTYVTLFVKFSRPSRGDSLTVNCSVPKAKWLKQVSLQQISRHSWLLKDSRQCRDVKLSCKEFITAAKIAKIYKER